MSDDCKLGVIECAEYWKILKDRISELEKGLRDTDTLYSRISELEGKF